MIINDVELRGTICSYAELFFTTMQDEYYKIGVEIKRVSGDIDIIPVVIPRKQIDPNADYNDLRIHVKGLVQTRRDENGHLNMYVFAKESSIYAPYENEEDVNKIHISGILKNKVIRKTSLSQIDIADVFFVNRDNYYPCIVWRDNVKLIKQMDKNSKFDIYARFQSRPYEKDNENKIAYELSISKLEKIA